MAEPFLTIDDLTEHLGSLPDWYVQVLEARERNACDVCPEDEIEIELTDFSGRPISGEPWFVFMENTNGTAVSRVNTDVDPFLNGAGQTTPSPLILNPGAHVLDIAFGGETPITLNLTDAELGDEYEEQLYIFDTPVEYEGPLSYLGPSGAPDVAAYGDLRGVIAAYEAGVPNDALQDMLAEIETALRAAVGIFPDLSLTARNDAEAKLIAGMQMVPLNAHLHPNVVPMYQDAMTTFNDRREVMPGGYFFVGPDGVSYEDPHGDVVWGATDEQVDWLGIGEMLDRLQGYSSAFHIYAEAALESPDMFRTRIASAIRAGGYQVAGPPNIPRNQIRGGRNNYPSRGSGSNPKTKPTGRNGVQAHTQAHSRRPVKSNTTVKFKGVKAKLGEYFRTHMDPGHGVRNGRISGAHTPSAFKNAVERAGGEYRRVSTHPVDARIRKYEYRLPRADGTMRSRWLPKTVHEIPQSELRQLQLQALKNALIRHRGDLNTGSRPFIGYTRSGLKMEGYAAPISNGFEVRTLYFSLD